MIASEFNGGCFRFLVEAPNPSATCWREKIVMRPEIPFDGTDVSCLQKGQAIEEDDVDVDDRVWIS